MSENGSLGNSPSGSSFNSRASSPELTDPSLINQNTDLNQNPQFHNLSVKLDILSRTVKQYERSYQNMHAGMDSFRDYVFDNVNLKLEDQA